LPGIRPFLTADKNNNQRKRIMRIFVRSRGLSGRVGRSDYGGATLPDQVAMADHWLHTNASLTGAALEQAVDQQDWDPRVKALTQFPSVMDNLAENLAWTSSLGQGFHYQEPDAMAEVQVMRAKAQVAGTLRSNSQIIVTQQTPGGIKNERPPLPTASDRVLSEFFMR
jgi:hypothetical protein